MKMGRATGAFIIPTPAQWAYLSAAGPDGERFFRFKRFHARLSRIREIHAIHLVLPDAADKGIIPKIKGLKIIYGSAAGFWEQAYSAAYETGVHAVVPLDGFNIFFHAGTLERMLGMIQRRSAAVVLPSGFIGGLNPPALTRDALEWAVTEARSRAVPIQPWRLLEENLNDNFPCYLLSPPPSLNRPELRLTDEFIAAWPHTPPETESPQTTEAFYQQLVEALDRRYKQNIAQQCERFAETLFPAPRRPHRKGAIRVALLSHVTNVGGAENSLLHIAKHIDRKRFNITVICSGDGPLARAAAGAGADVAFAQLTPVAAGPAAYMSSAGGVAGILKKQRIDLLHINSIYACQMGVPAARACGIPVICHLRDMILNPAIVNNSLIHTCDKILAVSQAARDMALAWRTNPRKIEVIYNGVDLTVFRPDLNPTPIRTEMGLGTDPVITMVAHMSPWKGHTVFLEAAALILKQFPTAHFLMVGEERFPGRAGGYREQLEVLIMKRRMRQAVLMLGEREDVPAILAATQVFVLASVLPDPFPRSVIEALACGLPAVGSDIGGIPQARRRPGPRRAQTR